MFLTVLQVLLILSAFGNIKMDQYAKCEIEQYMTPNYVYMRFENGITVSITKEGSSFKIALDDDFRQRDLGTHPCWNGVNRKLLVKTWIRHILSNRAKPEHLEAIFDVVLNEFDI